MISVGVLVSLVMIGIYMVTRSRRRAVSRPGGLYCKVPDKTTNTNLEKAFLVGNEDSRTDSSEEDSSSFDLLLPN